MMKPKQETFEVIQTGLHEKPSASKPRNTMDREMQDAQQLLISPIHCTAEDLADRAKSFDLFRKSYRKNEAMEENRSLLKEKFGRGKELGTIVNDSRNKIKTLTNQIEQIRKENAMRGFVDENGEVIRTKEEDQHQ